MCPGKHNVLAFLHSVGPKAPDPDDEIRKVLWSGPEKCGVIAFLRSVSR